MFGRIVVFADTFIYIFRSVNKMFTCLKLMRLKSIDVHMYKVLIFKIDCKCLAWLVSIE